jgi:membrane protease YdiL (CAAX protease family)
MSSVLNTFLVVISVYVYVSLARQISARAPQSGPPGLKLFGLVEGIVAGILIGWFLFVLLFSSPTNDHVRNRDLAANALVSIGFLLLLVTFLRLRGFNVDLMAGFSRVGFGRIIAMGALLLLAAYPLIVLAEAITQRLLGSGSSRQEIVELFNGSQTIGRRVAIILLAVAIAPIAEEFVFRFFLYGVLKRYLGRALAVVLASLLFAAVHQHLPSFGPLFVLGSCFAIAYEWSGSILVTMTMHSLFNSLTLVALAFPQTLPQ